MYVSKPKVTVKTEDSRVSINCSKNLFTRNLDILNKRKKKKTLPQSQTSGSDLTLPH